MHQSMGYCVASPIVLAFMYMCTDVSEVKNISQRTLPSEHVNQIKGLFEKALCMLGIRKYWALSQVESSVWITFESSILRGGIRKA